MALTVPGSRTLYITMTRDNARDLFFEPLKEYLRELGQAFETNETRMTVSFPNGSLIRCGGCDDQSDVPKYRGGWWTLVLLDEAQSFPEAVLEPLVNKVITPTLADKRGALSMLGTPPDTEDGMFYDTWHNKPMYRKFRWTVDDNPHVPEGELQAIMASRGIGPGHPIWQREIEGLFVADPLALVYEIDPARNYFTDDQLPKGTWRYVLSIDLGYQDRDAIAVLGWSDLSPTLYLVEEWQENHLDVDQLEPVVKRLYDKYKPQAVVGDNGGGGKKTLVTIENRLRVAILPKPPETVLTQVGYVNDEYRTGRLKIRADGPLAKDLRHIKWKEGKRHREIDDGNYHSDLEPCIRYAMPHCGHYRYTPMVPELTPAQRVEEQRKRRMLEQQRDARELFG